MASKGKKGKGVSFSPADVANVANAAKTNPYIQRLIEDASLRENVQKAIESSKRAYGRLGGNGRTPARSLLEDKKLQAELRQTLEAVRDASIALSEAPKKRVRKGRRIGRKLVVVGLAGGLALAGSEKLRSKVLDALFGAEEEFEYTPPPGAASTPPATPVSAA
jgi:hypothetical protein